MEKYYIISAEQIIDQNGDLNNIDQMLLHINSTRLRNKHLIIDPLSAGWFTPQEKGHFRSGNSAIEAIEFGCKYLNNNIFDVITISGKDFLKSDYDRQERTQMMEIYNHTSLIEMYTKLSEEWCKKNSITENQFIKLADLLLNNYIKTYEDRFKLSLPDINSKWLKPITSLFRGIDCANPAIDYEGKLIIATTYGIKKLNLDLNNCIEIKGISTIYTKDSGMEAIPEIATYQHLSHAISNTIQQANIDLITEFTNHNVMIEVYTCFPIAPLSFLQASGLAKTYTEFEHIILNYPITITGGMNLAKAAWNNPALWATIQAFHLLKKQTVKYIGIHGNGGLGEKQGFMILEGNKR